MPIAQKLFRCPDCGVKRVFNTEASSPEGGCWFIVGALVLSAATAGAALVLIVPFVLYACIFHKSEYTCDVCGAIIKRR